MSVIKTIKTSYTKIKLVFFLFVLINSDPGFAQQPMLEFSSLSTLEDISTINATVVTQDSNGFLWIGSEEGLYRFDGQSIYTYLHNANDNNTIPSNRINKLFVDQAKNLWVCTSEGLCRYNPELDHFIQLVVESDTKGVAAVNIHVIAEDHTGQLFVAYEKSIYSYDRSKNLFLKVLELKQGKINALIFDDLDNIWIAASFNGGLFYYNRDKEQLSSYLNDPASIESISNNEVTDIALVDGILWIATYGAGIDSYSIKNNLYKHYLSPEYFENFANSIFVDRNKKIWICTLGCLKLFNQAADNFYNYYHQPNNPKSPGKSLSGIYEDNQGNYWTIHLTGGIRVAKSRNKFRYFNSDPESFWYLTEKNATSISGDGSGNIWIGNHYNGIDVFNWGEHRVDRYTHQEKDPKSLGNGTIFSIFRDSKDQMWIGSNMGGLQRFIPETKKFETYLNKTDDTLSIASNDVRFISEDANGDLWIAVHGKGIDRFDVKSKSFHHFNAKNNSLSNDFTFQVMNDSRGNLWVATGWGLNLLQKGDALFKNFLYNKSDSSTINNNFVFSIHEDSLQNIWAGTPEGLNKYDIENQTFTRFSAGLKNTQVVSILSDQKNNIWVGTRAGISKFDPDTRKFTNFNQNDGLLSREFNVRSLYRNKLNELFFGGTEGIDVFNPDSLKPEPNRQRVFLTDFKLFNKSISYKHDSTIITQHISRAKQIVLDYKSNSFSFLYRVVKLPDHDKITYAYKLTGFDDDWIFAEKRTEASYTNLNPGNYLFRVKARYDNGNWSDTETSIELIIVPAWWMTIWFKILMVLFVLSVTSGLIFWRMKRLNHHRIKLEKLVIERTNEILNKNELLKSQALTLSQTSDQLKDLHSTKNKLFSIISHDLRSPFNGILGFQALLIKNYFDFTDDERIEMITQVHSSTNHVYYLVENLLSWAKIQNNSIQQIPVKFDVRSEILSRLGLYQSAAKTKGILFDHQLPEKLTAFADVNLLKTTLRNLIDNAIKFTPAGGTILIKVSQENDVIRISVIDSGTGMTQKQTDNLFNLEQTQPTVGTNGEIGSGLGLILCREFVEKNKGLLTVETKSGEGSTFTFTIPAATGS